MELQLNDLVHIQWGRLEFVEKIEEHCRHNNYFKTSNFLIRDDFIASHQHPTPYTFYFSIKKVWRLDESGNYILIYPEPEKEETAKTETEEDIERNQ